MVMKLPYLERKWHRVNELYILVVTIDLVNNCPLYLVDRVIGVLRGIKFSECYHQNGIF